TVDVIPGAGELDRSARDDLTVEGEISLYAQIAGDEQETLPRSAIHYEIAGRIDDREVRLAGADRIAQDRRAARVAPIAPVGRIAASIGVCGRLHVGEETAHRFVCHC